MGLRRLDAPVEGQGNRPARAAILGRTQGRSVAVIGVLLPELRVEK